MCGFCGLVGGAEHWSEMRQAPRPDDDPLAQGSRQRERLHRIALLDRVTRHYGVRVRDWAGSSFILAHVTGETVVIGELAQLWPEVERLAKVRCDPLSPALLAFLGRESGGAA